MMRIVLKVLVLCCTLPTAIYAQKNGSISGVVVDSENNPVEKATVAIINEADSTVLSYMMTTPSGKFSLERLPTDRNLQLNINHVNIIPYIKQIRLQPNQKLLLDTIRSEGVAIDEVLVSYQAPIRLNGDSLEYKADYFKTRPNASVEELLKLLPGLQVNVDGSILFEGREVSGIRVNNKDFFTEDITTATRNLDASLIDIVQVIKEKADSKRELLDDTQLPIIINLKTKKEFLKASFGKFYGSGGTGERYESGALVNTFRDTLQVSFIGYANNLGRNGFEYSEMLEHGGLERGNADPIYNYSWGGLQNNIYAGLNTNYDVGNKLKTNLMYSYQNQKNIWETNSTNETIYENITEQAESDNNSDAVNHRNSLRLFARYTPDSTLMLSLTGNFNFNKGNNDGAGNMISNRTDGTPVAQSASTSNRTSKGDNQNVAFVLEKKLFPSKILMSLNSNYNNYNTLDWLHNSSLSNFYLFNDQAIDQSIINDETNRNKTWRNAFNVQIPLKEKTNIDVYTNYNSSEMSAYSDIWNRQNSDEFISRNDVANNKIGRFGTWDYGATLHTRLRKVINLSLGLKQSHLDRNYDFLDRIPSIDDNNSYLLPTVRINIKGLNIGYNRDVTLPNFHSVVAVNSDLYPTSLTMASPYFDNQISDDFNMSYFGNLTKSKINFNIVINHSLRNNSIGYASTYDVENSFSTRHYYQADANSQTYGYINLSKTFVQNKTWNLRYNGNLNLNYGNSFMTVNGIENTSTYTYSNISNTLDISYKNNISIIPTYTFGQNSNRNSVDSDDFRDVINNTHGFGVNVRLDQIKKFRLETSYTLRNQQSGIASRNNLHLVNASMYYPILRNRGEVKLTAFDILNQNQDIYYGGAGNNTYYQESLTLRQYFMLGIVYKFLKNSGGK